MRTYLLLLLSIISSTNAFNMRCSMLDRRDAIYLAAGAGAAASFNKKPAPICVIGANGETGKECVRLLAAQHQPVRAVSRKFTDTLSLPSSDLIETVSLDIKDSKAVSSVIRDASAVIFLANAKKIYRYFKSDIEEFQNYEDIDIFALKNIAKSCIQYNVPRLVYVSASCKSCQADDRLDIDKISGIECENCLTKQAGENIIRQLYTKANNPKTAYTIVRVGYLFNGENRGAEAIEINQDYTKSGMISRTDLANICINSINTPETAKTTFEAYYRDTTQPYDVKDSLNRCMILGKSVEECFFGSEYKNKKPKSMEEIRKTPIKGSLFTTGKEYNGESWKELFKDLQKDVVAAEKSEEIVDVQTI